MLLRHSVLHRARTFRRLWIGQSVSVIGDGMQRIALLWWAKHHGGNGLLIAVALATIVPVVVCSPVGGWLADRRDRRTLLVGADVARIVTSLVLGQLLLGGSPPVIVVCLLIAVAGAATAVFDPTYAATVPTVVDAADLRAANGLNMANSAVGGLLGPLLGGVLIGVVDIGWLMIVNAATFAWSAACVLACRLPRQGHEVQPAHPSSGRGSSRIVSGIDGLRPLLGLAAVLNMVAAPVPMLIVALAVDRFAASSATFGLLEIMLSAGVLTGALGAAKLTRGGIIAPMVLLGLCLAAAGAMPIAGSAIVLFAGGVAIAVANTELTTLFQQIVPPEMRGRVFGLVGSISEGLRPAGLALGAPLLATVGVTGSFLTVGVGVVLATLAWGPSVRGVAASAAVTFEPQPNQLVDER
jgi:MFS family permease